MGRGRRREPNRAWPRWSVRAPRSRACLGEGVARMGRRGLTAGRRWGVALLVVVLLVPGTPEVLLRLDAERLARQQVLGAAAVGRNALPQAGERYQAAPPTPSGAFAN